MQNAKLAPLVSMVLLCAPACGSEGTSNNVPNAGTNGSANGQTNGATNAGTNSQNPAGCPERFQQYGDTCPAADLTAGETCAYSGCNEPVLACVDGTWRLMEAAEPETEACRDLCTDSCQRLVDDCGIDWGDCCRRACNSNFACPGETVGQDRAICDGEQADVASMTCEELVARVRDGWRADDACGPVADGG